MGVGKKLLFLPVACIAAWTAVASDTPLPRSVESNSIEALFQVTDDLFSGGEPKGQTAFEELQALGIRTIISVDGAKPDVESARAVGIRYIHIPTSYSGWARDEQSRLIAAARIALTNGPVFIHCHHGTHRGPAATAVICMGLKNWSTEVGKEWLGQAGTGPHYTGLFDMVEQFTTPTKEALDSAGTDFPEIVEPTDIIDSMTAIDRHMENIKALVAVETTSVDPHIRDEALLLTELLIELERNHDPEPDAVGFQAALEKSLNAAKAFQEQVESATAIEDLRAPFEAIRASCRDCHRSHRDTQ